MGPLPLFARRDFPPPAHDKNAGGEGFAAGCDSKGVIVLYESRKKPKRWLRYSLGALLALLVLSGAPARAVTPRTLVPVGHTVGVKLFSRGVVVVKLTEGGTPARSCGLRTGDVIVKCNGDAVSSSEQFQSLLQKSGGDETDLQIRRNGGSMTLSVEPEQNDQGLYCIGAWIRDSMAGIGTVTFYDPETGVFGALGHGVADADTAQLMPFSNGSILPSTVKAVKKGEPGAAGELRGDFDTTQDLGVLYANTASGIFGTAAEDRFSPAGALPVGEAQTGPAQILANVQGDKVAAYDIEILKTVSGAEDGRDMVLAVTDPDLIAVTGGIVQGMSGSPIIQEGRLVGAVTHVLVNQPEKGYGISIGNMLNAAGLAGE